MPDLNDGPQIRWEVGADLIDLDEMASVYVAAAKLRRRTKSKSNPNLLLVIWGLFLAIVILVIVDGGATEMVFPIVMIVVLFGLVLWFNRSAPRRLATQLRSVAASSEPYTFVADGAGMHTRAVSGSDDLAWSRCVEVLVIDGYLVLVLGLLYRVVPDRARVPSPLADSTDDVVAQIRAWMAAATGSSGTVDSPWSRWQDGGASPT